MSSKQANLSAAFEENIMNWLKKNKFSGFAKNPAIREGLMGAGVGGAVGLGDAYRQDTAGELKDQSAREKMMTYLKNIGGYGAVGGALGGGMAARKGLKLRDALAGNKMEALRPALARHLEKIEAQGLTGRAREKALQGIMKDLETSVPHTDFSSITKSAPQAGKQPAKEITKSVEKTVAPEVEQALPENTRKAKKFNLASTVYDASEAAKKVKNKVAPVAEAAGALAGRTGAGVSNLISKTKEKLAPVAEAVGESARKLKNKIAPPKNRRKGTGLLDKIKWDTSADDQLGELAQKAKTTISPALERAKKSISSASESVKNKIKNRVEELRVQGAANRADEAAVLRARRNPTEQAEEIARKMRAVNEASRDFVGSSEPTALERASVASKPEPSVVQPKPEPKQVSLTDFAPERAKGKATKGTGSFERFGGTRKPEPVIAPKVPVAQKQRELLQKEFEHHMNLLAEDSYNPTHIANAQKAKRSLEALDRVDDLMSSGNVSSKQLSEAAKRIRGVSLPRVEEAATQNPVASKAAPIIEQAAASSEKKPAFGSFMGALKREEPSSKGATQLQKELEHHTNQLTGDPARDAEHLSNARAIKEKINQTASMTPEEAGMAEIAAQRRQQETIRSARKPKYVEHELPGGAKIGISAPETEVAASPQRKRLKPSDALAAKERAASSPEPKTEALADKLDQVGRALGSQEGLSPEIQNNLMNEKESLRAQIAAAAGL